MLIISFVFLLTPTVSFADADRIFKLNSKAVNDFIEQNDIGKVISVSDSATVTSGQTFELIREVAYE